MSNKPKFKSSTQKPKKETKKQLNVAFRTFLHSLINNNAAYQGGKTQKWWLALILFVSSIVVALVPRVVTVLKTDGADALSGTLYHTDVALQKFTNKLNEEDVNITVAEDVVYGKTLYAPEFEKVKSGEYQLTDSLTTVVVPYFSYTELVPTSVLRDGVYVTEDVEYEFLRVYYTAHISDNFLFNKQAVTADSYLASSLLSLDGTKVDQFVNVTTHLILGQKSIFFRLYNPQARTTVNTPAQNFRGVVSALKVGLNLKSFDTLDANSNPISPTSFDYKEKYFGNWEQLFSASYPPVRTQIFWQDIGVNSIIFTIIGLMMGIIIWISTRGKNNPHRDLKFSEAVRVGAWLLPTPALITLIMGFVMPNYFTLAFVMSLGMRSVWLTMRTLSPQQPEQK